MESTICPLCNQELAFGAWPFCPHEYAGTSNTIVDECDVMIRHGICNPDGTPKRYRSKAEIKKAAFEAGWTHGNDTPKVNERLLEREHNKKR